MHEKVWLKTSTCTKYFLKVYQCVLKVHKSVIKVHKCVLKVCKRELNIQKVF